MPGTRIAQLPTIQVDYRKESCREHGHFGLLQNGRQSAVQLSQELTGVLRYLMNPFRKAPQHRNNDR